MTKRQPYNHHHHHHQQQQHKRWNTIGNKWVRSVEASSTGHDVDAGEGRGGVVASVATVATAATAITTPRNLGPILKGPAPRMSWKRPRPHPSQTAVPPVVSTTTTNGNKTWSRKATMPNPLDTVSGERDMKQEPLSSVSSAYSMSGRTLQVGSSALHRQDMDAQSKWKKIGLRKCVQSRSRNSPKYLPEKDGDDRDVDDSGDVNNTKTPNDKRQHDHPRTEQQSAVPGPGTNHSQQQNGLKKIASNKLVVHREGARPKQESQILRKRKSEIAASDLRYAKRIRIVETTPITTTTTDDCAVSDDSSSPIEDQDQSKEVEGSNLVLTTFAYCQPTAIDAGNMYGSLKRWKKTRLLSSHHSLVRVPTTDSTRICPYFAKGMTCQDEACLLRHDVPAEATMPTCFYFLHHNGMCLKENCPFRHVKTGTTEPCPRFLQTGYCTLANCPLAHVQHKNKTLAVNTKEKKATAVKERQLVFYDN